MTTARAVANRLRSPISARSAAAPMANRPVIEVTSAVSPSSSRTRHPPFGLGEQVLGMLPVSGQQGHPLQRAGPVRDHPGRIGERGEQPAHDPQARVVPALNMAPGLYYPAPKTNILARPVADSPCTKNGIRGRADLRMVSNSA